MANDPSAELPELQDMIPLYHGEVYSFHNHTYYSPLVSEIGRMDIPDHGLIRVGFKVYEVHSWIDSAKAYQVRQFYCNLTQRELWALARGRGRDERPNGRG